MPQLNTERPCAAGITPRPLRAVLNLARCAPDSAITAATFVFRLRHQNAARRRRTTLTICVAHVAFE